jgi:hypothetical protein
MTWREFGDFLHSQRCAINPRPISEFARIGEKAADTFGRLEKTTRGPLDEAVRRFAKTKNWPVFSDEQIIMLCLRLPISLFAETPQSEQKQLSKNYAPFGRLIPCELIVTVDSSGIQTPIIGLVTEDIYHNGRLANCGN